MGSQNEAMRVVIFWQEGLKMKRTVLLVEENVCRCANRAKQWLCNPCDIRCPRWEGVNDSTYFPTFAEALLFPQKMVSVFGIARAFR